jgi:hypothetical protein
VAAGLELKGVHHSTPVAGGPVAGAGMLTVKAGQIVDMDDTSGHYKPQAEHLLQTVEWLREKGMRVDDINLKDIAQQKAAAVILQEWLRRPVERVADSSTTATDDEVDGWMPPQDEGGDEPDIEG